MDALDLPANIEAEQAVIGAVLMDNAAFDAASRILKEDDFFEEVHRMLWNAISETLADSRPVSPVNLAPAFKGLEVSENMSAQQYIARLASQAVPAIAVGGFVSAVLECAQRRRLIATGRDLIASAQANVVVARPSVLAATAIENLDAVVMEASISNQRVHIGAAAAQVVDQLQRVARGEPIPIVRTGILSLDKKLGGGFKKTESIVIAGRPGAGKSALGTSIALNVAASGGGVVYFSLEMGAEQLAARALSCLVYEGISPIEYKRMRGDGVSSDDDLERLIIAQRRLATLPFEIEPQAGLSLSQIVQRARRHKQRFEARGIPLAMVLIDHIGLIKTNGKRNETREREVAMISVGCKEAAKSLDTVMVPMSQLSRKVEERDDKRPRLADLRESGSLEADADIVMMVYRPSYYLAQLDDPESADEALKRENELEAILAKTRMGPNGTAHLFCDIGSNYIADRKPDAIEFEKLQPSFM